jgi:hypothetical protein
MLVVAVVELLDLVLVVVEEELLDLVDLVVVDPTHQVLLVFIRLAVVVEELEKQMPKMHLEDLES